MKVGSLFSGIGGFDLGLERAGFTIEWQVEINDYATKVLAKHWPSVPRYRDIRAIDWAAVSPVNVLCGGFPCQDLSPAGHKAGLREGTRSGYDAEWSMFPASAFGFPHCRERVWIIAYPHCKRWEAGKNEILINLKGVPSQRGANALGWMVEDARSRDCSISRDLRNGHGIPNFMDRLRGLGNAIVPQIAEALGRMIMEAS